MNKPNETVQLDLIKASAYRCKTRNNDVMILFMYKDDPNRNGVHDLFLTQEMAESLLAGLSAVVALNKAHIPT